MRELSSIIFKSRQKGKYLNSSLPQYQDLSGTAKIIEEALAKTGRK